MSSSDSDSDNEPPLPPGKTKKKKAKTAQDKAADEAAWALLRGGGRTPDGVLDRRETIRRFEAKEAMARRQASCKLDQGTPLATRNAPTAAQKDAEATHSPAAARALNAAGAAAPGHSSQAWCNACRRDGCGWEASCDVSAVAARRAVLGQELHYVRAVAVPSLESYVPLSAMRGGATQFRRCERVALFFFFFFLSKHTHTATTTFGITHPPTCFFGFPFCLRAFFSPPSRTKLGRTC